MNANDDMAPLFAAIAASIRQSEDNLTRTEAALDASGVAPHGLAGLPWYAKGTPKRRAELERIYRTARAESEASRAQSAAAWRRLGDVIRGIREQTRTPARAPGRRARPAAASPRSTIYTGETVASLEAWLRSRPAGEAGAS